METSLTMFCIKYFDFSWKHHIITSVLYTLLAVVIIVLVICLCKKYQCRTRDMCRSLMITSQHEQVNDISMEMDGLGNAPNEDYELGYEDSFPDMSTYDESYRMEYDDDYKNDEQNVIYYALHDDNDELIQPSCSREYQYLLSDEEQDEENGQSQFVVKRKFATFTEGLSSTAKQVTQRLYVNPYDEFTKIYKEKEAGKKKRSKSKNIYGIIFFPLFSSGLKYFFSFNQCVFFILKLY